MASRYIRKQVPLEVKALPRTPQHTVAPAPEAADDENLQYIEALQQAFASYTPPSSNQSSPTNAESQSTLSVSQGEWTTGNTTERSSLDSSYYSLDEFDRQAASTVSHHFEEFESMLYEGSKEIVSNAYFECQEWSARFPHLRVLGKQLVVPQDTGFHFVTPTTSSSRYPSASEQLDHAGVDKDFSFISDISCLALSGRQVKFSQVPGEPLKPSAGLKQNGLTSNSSYDYGQEETFAQDGIYEDIIAIDYKNMYEDMEHKKQITPRRRRLEYPPITPSACVKDSVFSAAFDNLWHEIMSWVRSLLRKYSSEILASKKEALPAPSHVSSRPFFVQGVSTFQGTSMLDGMLKISSIPLQTRNSLIDSSESSVGLMAKSSRPSTVHPHQRFRGGRFTLEPLREISRVSGLDEGKRGQSPHDALSVRQIVSLRLPSPPATHLPPLENSPGQSSRRINHRASSAVDNKESRQMVTRERSNNAMEVNRPSTTQAMRSDTPYSVRGASTPLGQLRQHFLMNSASMSLNITGSGLHPSSEANQLPANILEDPEDMPLEDIHQNHWMPTAQKNNPYRRMRHHLR